MIQRRTEKTPRAPAGGLHKKTQGKGRNRVRIVGGEWRSRIVEFPDAPGLRPTSDRVRETLFNWLGQALHGKRCLDLFAGSGALGFEAASRGASQVVMVEHNRAVYAALESNAERLKASHVALRYADSLSYLQGCGETFDVVFLDPPFQADVLPAVLSLLPPKLADGGIVYLESGKSLAEAAPGWRLLKQGKAGMVNFGLLRPA
jgi:16S rRNA (guanine966-N2)-methyltransferase